MSHFYLQHQSKQTIGINTPPNYHHQHLIPDIGQRWVRRSGLYCPQLFVKTIAPLSVSTCNWC